MQADEIIQQKEWHQLSGDEMKTVQELAANEQEYNLIKKMLRVSAEEVRYTPSVDPRIKEQLMAAVGSPHRNSRKLYWYAAAAVVLILVCAGLFLLQKKQKETTAKKDPVEKNILQPPIAKQETIIKKDSLVIAIKTPPVNDTANDTALIVKAVTPRRLQRKNTPRLQQDVYAAVNTRLSNDKELLSLVTEIY